MENTNKMHLEENGGDMGGDVKKNKKVLKKLRKDNKPKQDSDDGMDNDDNLVSTRDNKVQPQPKKHKRLLKKNNRVNISDDEDLIIQDIDEED